MTNGEVFVIQSGQANLVDLCAHFQFDTPSNTTHFERGLAEQLGEESTSFAKLVLNHFGQLLQHFTPLHHGMLLSTARITMGNAISRKWFCFGLLLEQPEGFHVRCSSV